MRKILIGVVALTALTIASAAQAEPSDRTLSGAAIGAAPARWWPARSARWPAAWSAPWSAAPQSIAHEALLVRPRRLSALPLALTGYSIVA